MLYIPLQKYYQAAKLLSTLDPEEAANITEQLIQVTKPKPNNQSLLPNDLGASARIVTVIVQVLENNNSTDEVYMCVMGTFHSGVWG